MKSWQVICWFASLMWTIMIVAPALWLVGLAVWLTFWGIYEIVHANP